MNLRIQRVLCFTFTLCVFMAPATGTFAQCADPADNKAIIGSWRGLSGEGNPILLSATSDQTVSSSVVSEISLSLKPNVLTPGHGVWTHIGGRTFELTIYGLLYSISNGRYQGYLRAKARLTVSPDCNTMSGTDKVEIFDPNNILIFAVPQGNTSFEKTRPQPYD